MMKIFIIFSFSQTILAIILKKIFSKLFFFRETKKRYNEPNFTLSFEIQLIKRFNKKHKQIYYRSLFNSYQHRLKFTSME